MVCVLAKMQLCVHVIVYRIYGAYCRLGGYETLIRNALTAAGLDSVTITNRGMNGARIPDMEAGSANWRMPSYFQCLMMDMPTIALIFIGTNDCPYFPSIPYFQVTLN